MKNWRDLGRNVHGWGNVSWVPSSLSAPLPVVDPRWLNTFWIICKTQQIYNTGLVFFRYLNAELLHITSSNNLINPEHPCQLFPLFIVIFCSIMLSGVNSKLNIWCLQFHQHTDNDAELNTKLVRTYREINKKRICATHCTKHKSNAGGRNEDLSS